MHYTRTRRVFSQDQLKLNSLSFNLSGINQFNTSPDVVTLTLPQVLPSLAFPF